MHNLLFNGYRLDQVLGRSYSASITGDATQPIFLEGDYIVNVTTKPNWQTNVPFTPSCQPLNQTLASTKAFLITPKNSVTRPFKPSYLFDYNATPLQGIQVEQSFFHCLNSSALLRDKNTLSLKIKYATPWMTTARKEIGQREVVGKKANPKILEYYKASNYWGKDDSGRDNAWCASFTSWIMEQHGYVSPKSSYRAKSWKNFGKTIPNPIYGAIGIKSRKGGGHVAFVMGKSSDGKYLYMLGGNQDDQVQVKRYATSVWDTFVVPSNYDASKDTLPIYRKSASNAGRED